MTLFDISRPLRPSLAVWPGDTPYSHRWVMRRNQGDSVNVSTLTLSAHTGTHVDAPYHVADDGIRIGDMPLHSYIGPATVVHLQMTGAIQPEHLAHIDLSNIDRLLIRTAASYRAHDVWSADIAYLSPGAAEMLGEHGLCLFGTDAPSVDPIDSRTLDAHRILNRHQIAILEGTFLRDVPPGDYELIALPLNLAADGCPVRAVLRTLA